MCRTVVLTKAGNEVLAAAGGEAKNDGKGRDLSTTRAQESVQGQKKKQAFPFLRARCASLEYARLSDFMGHEKDGSISLPHDPLLLLSLLSMLTEERFAF